MKILVTGGAGFIGSNLVDRLIENGDEVYVLDNLSTGLKSNVNPKVKRFINPSDFTSITMEDALDILISHVDQVYHLAASVGYFNILQDPLKHFNNNVSMVELVARSCFKYKKKMLFTSSSEVYGYTADDCKEYCNLSISYHTPETPKDSYAISKWVGEFIVRDIIKDGNFVITRLFNTSGKRQRPDFGMVIPRFINQVITDKNVTVFVKEGTYTRRSFCHVDDTINILMCLMNSEVTSGEIYNVGSVYNTTTIATLAEKIIDCLCDRVEYTGKIEECSYCVGYNLKNFTDVFDRVPNNRKLIEVFNWEPQIPLEQIIMDNYNWQMMGIK